MSTIIAKTYRCHACGGDMVLRNGPRGEFLGCANFRNGCRNTLSLPKDYHTGADNSGWLDEYLCNTGTDEQMAIWNDFVSQSVHMCVNAGPGTGKSFTAANMIKFIKNQHENASILYLVFGKANQTDFMPKARINMNGREHVLAQVSTMNAFGNSIVTQFYKNQGVNCRFDGYKHKKILASIFVKDDFAHLNGISLDLIKGDLIKLCEYCKAWMLTGAVEDLYMVAERFGIILHDAMLYSRYVQNMLRVSCKFLDKGAYLYDYSDQLWMPVSMNMNFPKYDFVMCDEAQDMNPAQHHMVMKLAQNGARVLFIGDIHQCQPGNTLVTMTGNTQKRIDELKIGDEVVSYDRKGAAFVGITRQGRRVLDVNSRRYVGPMINVVVGDRNTQCTPNHKWIIRWDNRDTHYNVVYMMRKNNCYRIGWCQLFTKTGDSHLAQRARIEGADAAWILSVHLDKTSASMQESFIAAQYGLPTIPFNQVDGATHLHQTALDAFWERINMTGDHQLRAISTLESLGRMIDHPFYNVDNRKRQGRTTIFETEACNLIHELMCVPVFNSCANVEWSKINVSTYQTDELVYSLKIETHETYIANEIATHNSIYGFRGADTDSMDNLANMLEDNKHTLMKTLSYTRRLPKSGVRLLNQMFPGLPLHSMPDAIEGKVYHAQKSKATDIMIQEDLVVSRINAPLIGLAFRLIKEGKIAYILGRDIGKKIIEAIESKEAKTIPDLIKKTRTWQKEAIQKYLDECKTKAQEPSEYVIETIDDTALCIVEIATNVKAKKKRANISDVITEIRSLFKSPGEEDGAPPDAIVLSTVHKAKGLESNNVHIWTPDLFPHPLAKKPWEQEQERNCQWVAYSRHKQNLYIYSNCVTDEYADLGYQETII